MEQRTTRQQPAWLGAWLTLGRARSTRLSGAFMSLCALVACGDGKHTSLATPVLFYNGSSPFAAVIGEPMELTPAVFWTIDHYTVRPSLPPGLSLDPQSGVISGTPTRASRSATYMVQARGAGVRASFPLVISVAKPPNYLSSPSSAALTGQALLKRGIQAGTGR